MSIVNRRCDYMLICDFDIRFGIAAAETKSGWGACEGG